VPRRNCQGLMPGQNCELTAQGKADVHGCETKHLCLPCFHHLEMILDQIFGIGIDMECGQCNNRYSRSDWFSWEPYESVRKAGQKERAGGKSGKGGRSAKGRGKKGRR